MSKGTEPRFPVPPWRTIGAGGPSDFDPKRAPSPGAPADGIRRRVEARRPAGIPLPPYAELHCLSNFTFLRGASHPHELVERAAELGYSALAITDECSLAGVVRAHEAAREVGLPLLIGSEIRLEEGERLVLLATDREGYGNLSELITLGRRRAAKGEYRLGRSDLEGGLPGCLALLIPDAPLPGEVTGTAAAWLAARFSGRAWIAVELHLGGADHRHLAALEELSRRHGLPLVAAGGVLMHRRGRRPLQDLLTAIRLGVTVEEAGFALQPNGERHLRSRRRLARLYPPALLEESAAVARRCRFSLDELRYQYPDDLTPAGESPADHLRRLTLAGMAERWPDGAPERVRRQVEHELRIIAELGYEAYFLTVHDLICFARERNILCQGRGSAANSAVCYCLGITAVDPARIDTLFERFVSKERNEPPDIDIDFENRRREEVIQYIYRRYGRDRAALAATLIRYRRRSALRDTGRALGLSEAQLEAIGSSFAWWDRRIEPQRLREAGLDPDNPRIHRLLHLAGELTGFPRHLSQHVGGMVISRAPLARLVPMENAAMEQPRNGPATAEGHRPEALARGERPVLRTVIQWDKDDLDAVGLLKVDCLALGMLSALHHAFDLIALHRRRALDLATIPAEDPAVYEMICRADTMGVFQIESRAQMGMLPRLRPTCFYDLVIEVAIVRPGPIQGEMVHPYLRRRRGEEPVSYPSEAVRSVLERTLGVPIFQEQVIKLAMVAAGFSAGEADQLRRAIGSWRRREKLEAFRRKLVDGMLQRGYSRRFAEQIFHQIEGFGEYGFPESHAASFALLVYVSAWIKCHEPAIFTCALLNSQPMGFYAPAQLIQDARRHDVEVRPVAVNRSHWECTLEPREEPAARDGTDLALRLGLRMVKGFSREAAERLVASREEGGPFHSVEELARRARLEPRELERLADAGALETLAGDRHRARWSVLGVEETLPLFPETRIDESPPCLQPPNEQENLLADYASLGLTLDRHPMALLRPRLGGCRRSRDLATLPHRSTARMAGIVITRQHPMSAGGTVFLTLEDETGTFNVIVWERLTERYRKEVIQGRLLTIWGEVQREGEVIHLVARHLEDRTALLQGLAVRSRDFH